MGGIDELTRTTAALSVVDSATVVCIRRDPRGPPFERTVSKQELDPDGGGDAEGRERLLFLPGASAATFASGWQVLLGQREVVNWVRSSEAERVPMRYPGELVFPGGVVERGETPEAAARRELEEEFGLKVEPDAPLRLLSVRQTRAIRNKSNVMYNYVLHAAEHPGLAAFDASARNAELERRRTAFQELMAAGDFWRMSHTEREAVAPEVRRVDWLDLADAVRFAYTSLSLGPCQHVDDFQAAEFTALGIQRRDPLYITLLTLLQIEAFPSVRSLVRETALVDPVVARARAVWLADGLSPAEVAAAYAAGARTVEDCMTAEQLAALRTERLAADAQEAAEALEAADGRHPRF